MRAEEKSTALEQDLPRRQKMEMVGTLAGGIAHDFNNIISPILGYAELALGAISSDHPARSDIDQVRRAARRARELVNQILVFSRRDDQPKSPVRVRNIIREALTFIQSMVPSNVTIEQDIDSIEDLVMGNAIQIHQVVLNIAINAIQAMRDTGGVFQVMLRCCVHGLETATRLGVAPGPFLVLSFTDQGEGMDKDTTERIFEPFFTTKRKSGGTGLGLSVVHGIIHSHRGAIEVTSAPGKGSTFRIHLPTGPIETPPNIAEAVTLPLQGNGHVLIVDDEPMIVSFLHRLLDRCGFRVTGFTAPEQALAHFQAEPDAFDVVMLDRAMPKMNGFDLARTVKQLRPNVPLVLMTGFIEPEVQRDVSNLFAAVIQKPFDSVDAVHLIRRLIGLKTSVS